MDEEVCARRAHILGSAPPPPPPPRCSVLCLMISPILQGDNSSIDTTDKDVGGRGGGGNNQALINLNFLTMRESLIAPIVCIHLTYLQLQCCLC